MDVLRHPPCICPSFGSACPRCCRSAWAPARASLGHPRLPAFRMSPYASHGGEGPTHRSRSACLRSGQRVRIGVAPEPAGGSP
eukprot:scaffold2201_cov240-Pinguiococcus_pyrenoidosus.AAC.14